MSDISTYIKGNKTLRTIVLGLANTGELSSLDLFEEKDRLESLRIALAKIREQVNSQSTLDGPVKIFLTELLQQCDTSLTRPAPKKRSKSKGPTQQASVPMDVEGSEPTAPEKQLPAKPKAAAKKGKAGEKQGKKQATKPATSKGSSSPKNPPATQEKKKQKQKAPRLSRKLIPRDFPVSKNVEMFSDERFIRDLSGKDAFTKNWSQDEIKNCQQGDLHQVGACLICDTFRTRVDYYTMADGKVMAAKYWLPKPTPYQLRLCVLAHAFNLSCSTNFRLYTEEYAWFDFEKNPVQPRVSDCIILQAGGVRCNLPRHLGVAESELDGGNRISLSSLRRSLPTPESSEVDWNLE
jgi:hypothetical protein